MTPRAWSRILRLARWLPEPILDWIAERIWKARLRELAKTREVLIREGLGTRRDEPCDDATTKEKHRDDL